jgi:ferredoxin
MNVNVNRNECISCALCVDQCPAVFGFDHDNKAEVTHPSAADENSEQVKLAAYECPTSAIKLK